MPDRSGGRTQPRSNQPDAPTPRPISNAAAEAALEGLREMEEWNKVVEVGHSSPERPGEGSGPR